MLERAAGLSDRSLRGIAELEREVVEADGGRLKLEWGTLRGRRGERVEDLLWWDGARLLGFLGLYPFGPPDELVGMVAPAARRRGIASALLDAALPLCRERALCRGRGNTCVLLVVPRPSVAGNAFALRRGGILEHSEHALVLTSEPPAGPDDARISVRRAAPSDAATVTRLLAEGFGHAVDGVVEQLAPERPPTLLVERNGAPVGTLRVTRDGTEAGVYGFVIDAAWRGRGIGRDVLRRVCRQLRGDGAERVGLEVAVDNDRALGLYTSLGFVPVTTEDYYALPV